MMTHRVANTSDIPCIIYGMTLARVELKADKEYFNLARVEILKDSEAFRVSLKQASIRYEKLRFLRYTFDNAVLDATIHHPAHSPLGTIQDIEYTHEAIATCLNVGAAVACAIIKENELWTASHKWRNFDRRRAKAIDGLETVAEKFGIVRLLVGKDQRSGSWAFTEKRFDDWDRRMAENKLIVISAQP